MALYSALRYFLLQTEDDLIILVNGMQPHMANDSRHPHLKYGNTLQLVVDQRRPKEGFMEETQKQH